MTDFAKTVFCLLAVGIIVNVALSYIGSVTNAEVDLTFRVVITALFIVAIVLAVKTPNLKKLPRRNRCSDSTF